MFHNEASNSIVINPVLAMLNKLGCAAQLCLITCPYENYTRSMPNYPELFNHLVSVSSKVLLIIVKARDNQLSHGKDWCICFSKFSKNMLLIFLKHRDIRSSCLLVP